MQEELYIVQSDRNFAAARIEELQKEILALGPEFHDVFNQSSETWHDNAPFDALRDKQSLLDAELQGLRRVLRNAAPSLPKQKNSVVGIGCRVLVAAKGKDTLYFIAGDWTPRAGEKVDGATVISRQSPIAKLLTGLKQGNTFTFRGIEHTIQSLSYESAG